MTEAVVGLIAGIISPGGPDIIYGQNNSAINVYIGTGAELTVNHYTLKVDAGGTFQWPPNTPLWAVAIVPGASLNIATNGASSTSGSVAISNAVLPVSGDVNATIQNASIPVTGNVTAAISGTVNALIQNAVLPVNGNVNATILNASIPVSGAVNINAGNVTVNGSVSLLHSQDVLFSSASKALAIGNTTIYDTAGLVDLSNYSTIYVAIAQAGSYGFIELNTATETYYDHATGKGIANNYTWMKAGGISWFSNVVGSSFKVVVSNSVAVTNVTVLIIGMSSDEVPRATIYPITGPPQGGFSNFTIGTTLQLPGFYGFDVTITAAGQAVAYPIFTTGPNHVSQEMPSAAYNGWSLQYYGSPIPNSGRIQQFGSTGPYTSTPNIPVTLRAYPVVFASSTTASAGERFISTLTSDLGPVNAL